MSRSSPPPLCSRRLGGNGEHPADMEALGKMVQDIASNNAKRYFGV